MMSYDYPHPVSRTYQYKKITKPLLERKRRARINRCLEELKDLMVDALETEGENISKLEKADILELTVRHLQRLQDSGLSNLSSIDQTNEDNGIGESRWQSGFGHCATEACRYLAALPGESGEKLARHLASGLESSRKINIQIMPKESISPVLKNSDANSNHLMTRNMTSPGVLPMSETHQIPSPINSPQYCEIYEDVSKILPNNSRAQENISSPNILAAVLATVNDCSNVLSQNSPEMIIRRSDKIEDDEEIDVENIDERDPMWRPW